MVDKIYATIIKEISFIPPKTSNFKRIDGLYVRVSAENVNYIMFYKADDKSLKKLSMLHSYDYDVFLEKAWDCISKKNYANYFGI
jgi:acetoin utilization deacetylase AcuC-like enzyme